ncbi:MAG: carboxypeptidase regulatory-like domain-containing protein [Armatimonadota bacterium]
MEEEETNNFFSDPSFDDYTLGTTYVGANLPTGDIFLNTLRFFGSSANGGTLTIVPGRDAGGTALQLSRTSMAGDTGIGNWDVITVQPGHTYRMMVWAKTDSNTTIRLSAASYKSRDVYTGHIGDTCDYHSIPISSKWTLCAFTYTAPVNAVGVQVGFRADSIGNVTFDDFSMVDETNLTGNLFPDPSFDSFVLGSTCTTDSTRVGPFRYFICENSGGSMAVVDGQDAGGTAIRLSRNPAINYSYPDNALDMDNYYRFRIPIKYGHIYRFDVWAKANVPGSQLRLGVSGRQADMSTWVKDLENIFTEVGTDWAKYSYEFTPSSPSMVYALPGFRPWGPGDGVTTDITIDNASITDVTSEYTGTLTGTVSNALIGATIAGANITITSESSTLSATTDENGVYTIADVPCGTYKLNASATGYTATSISNIGVNITSTMNVGLMPVNTTWTVQDTFTRSATQPGDSSLGTTEGAYPIPWVKSVAGGVSFSGNTNSYISGSYTLVTSNATDNPRLYGSDNCGVGLGQSFMPADFDLSIDMNWDQSLMNSMWSGIGYRQSMVPAMMSGYFVNFPYAGDQIQLLYNGNVIATAAPTTTQFCWPDTTVRIVACGNSHKIYVNNELLINITDDNNMGGGYISLFCDTYNNVEWDNLNMSALPDGMITGGVYDNTSAEAIPGATVTIVETGEQIQPEDGTYSVSIAPGTYTLTASAAGYETQTKTAVVKPSETTTVEFNMLPAPTNVGTIAEAKTLADGTRVAVAETLVVTVGSKTYNNSSYYLENVDRAYGIKILHGSDASVGCRITKLAGTINTDANGERYIDVSTMNVADGDPIGALGMNNKAAVEPLAQGMLVKIWGKVTSVASDKSYFYVNDGSNIDDGTNNVGIRVDYSNSTVSRIAAISENEDVAITGVMGRSTGSIAVIRPKTSADVNNTVVDEVTVTPSDTSWILQVNPVETGTPTGSVTFASAPNSVYGSGNILMSVGANGDGGINLRTNNHAGLRIADITELLISNYMTYINGTGAKGIGVRINVKLDDILGNNEIDPTGEVDDVLTCDPYYDTYAYAMCRLNGWVTFDALNAGKWYSQRGLDGSSAAGPWKSLTDYLTAYPDAKIASVPNGGFRLFMGGSAPHWTDVTGYVDNVRIGTKDGTTVYNFEQ